MELSTNYLFTRCVECQNIQQITLEQLRDNRGVIRCPYCLQIFDGLRFISESKDFIDEQKERGHPWEKNPVSTRAYWKPVLIIVSVLLVGAQLLYFNRAYFMQSPDLRSKLQTLCLLLPCTIPLYADIKKFKVLHSSFDFVPEQGYLFNAVFINQANFSQAHPKIKLSLLNLKGQSFADRIFTPQDYLPKDSVSNTIAPQFITTITIKITAPKTSVGGYTFDFTE